jgi:hypothetical protein
MPARLRGIQTGPFERPSSVRKQKRPWSVILIVMFQILKAEILFSIVAVASGNSSADMLPRSYLKRLISLVTQRDIIDQDILVTSALWLMLLAAICITIVGLGLLLRTSWARIAAVIISGAEMIWLAYVMLMPAYELRTSIPVPSQEFLTVVLLLDALVIYVLVRKAQVFKGSN